MNTILKSICVAFSIYSKIPMPKFKWESSDMKYHLCFFPWIGAVIGLLEWGLYWLIQHFQMGTVLFSALGLAVPLLITGGFHLDGFMDTMDAIHSYQSREKKLEILKDPHIGAFSVICLLLYVLLFLGFFSEITDTGGYGVFCCCFFLARVLSGISVVCFPAAKKEGMLQVFSSTAEKKMVLGSLLLQLLLCVAMMMYLAPVMGAAAITATGLTFLYYQRMSSRQFGGITGDLAGFFVSMAELISVIAICVSSRLGPF